MRLNYIFFIIVFTAISSFAQVDRSKAPKADTPEKLNVGELIPINLENGLRIYLAQVTNYPKFTISVNIQLPGYNEETRLAEKEVLGLAYTKKLSKAYPNGEIDSISQFYGSMLSVHQYGGTIKGMKSDIDKLLDMYSDALLNPIITQEYIAEKALNFKKKQEKEKKSTAKVVSKSFSTESIIDSLLFGNVKTVEKKKTKGTRNYEGLEVNDVEKYLKDKIVANNSLIVIVGDFSESECKNLMNRYFGKWQKGESYERENPKNEKSAIIKNRKIVVFDSPTAVQSKISVRWHLGDAFTYFEDHIKLQVLNEIFGESQLSYLYKNLREDKGLCYSIRSSVSGSGAGGSGSVFTSVRNSQTAYAIENIILEMLRLRNEKVSDVDLRIAKNSLIGKHTRSLNGIAPVQYISFAMQKDLYNLPDDYLQVKVQKYYEITIDDIMEMAQKYINPFKCVISITGKMSELKGTLENFGDVLYFDKDGNRVY